ncbi:C2 domain-containing protein [Dichotomocladium elegans]|nr:C2 domain-containing protein [Dichotomocladium elegans]
MSQPRLIGELAVVALEATSGEFRPFCVFKVGNNAKRTNAATDGSRNPNWDAQVNMPIPHGYNQMSVQVLHEDPRGNQIICEGMVDLTKVLKEGECDDWYPLKQRGRDAGDIYLELTFYSVVKLSMDKICPILKN